MAGGTSAAGAFATNVIDFGWAAILLKGSCANAIQRLRHGNGRIPIRVSVVTNIPLVTIVTSASCDVLATSCHERCDMPPRHLIASISVVSATALTVAIGVAPAAFAQPCSGAAAAIQPPAASNTGETPDLPGRRSADEVSDRPARRKVPPCPAWDRFRALPPAPRRWNSKPLSSIPPGPLFRMRTPWRRRHPRRLHRPARRSSAG